VKYQNAKPGAMINKKKGIRPDWNVIARPYPA